MTDDGRRRVLLLIKGLGAGGAERLLVHAARHRDADRFAYEAAYLLPHKVALVGDLEDQGVPVRCIGTRSLLDPRWVRRRRRLVLDHRIDVVHVHSPLPAVGARLALRTIPRSRRPALVSTLHNVWPSLHWLTRGLERATAGLDDARFTVSDAVRASLPPGRSRHDRTVIHGIDDDQVRSAADRRAVRREIGADDGDLVIGTVANLRATKGHVDLVEAAALLGDRSGIRFVLVGDGTLRADLEADVARRGLTERVTFLGHRTDAHRLMSGFDVLCLPSHHEGRPLVVMEAQAIGLPVVATAVGGVPGMVTDGVDGLIVPPHRPALLAAALGGLLDDPGRRAEMGRRARDRELPSAARAAAEVERTYDELVAG